MADKWNAILQKHIATVEKLENFLATNDYGDDYIREDNHFLIDNAWDFGCEVCEESLSDTNDYMYHSTELDMYLCSATCLVRHIRDRISNFKLISIPSIKQLIAEEE